MSKKLFKNNILYKFRVKNLDMPTTSTERTRKYRANHKEDAAYKQYNKETTNTFRKEHAEEYKKKNAEHNRVYREKLKAKANATEAANTIGGAFLAHKARIELKGLQERSNAINTIASTILSRKARTDYSLLRTPPKSYYLRKKEAVLTGTPIVLKKRGRKLTPKPPKVLKKRGRKPRN